MSRTVIIGVDGVAFRYLDQFAGDLPNVTTLREEGVEAPLESTFPPWTPSAWPSIYTGRYPSEHGVHSFFKYPENDPTQRRIVSRNDVDAPAIWNYVDAAGRSSIVLNVPVTHPVEPIDGVVLPGYLAPNRSTGYPETIRDTLIEEDIDWSIYATKETAPSGPEKLDSYVDLIRSRASTADVLLSKFDWEFAFIQVQKTDAVFHNFNDEKAFRRVYRAMDEVVGTVRDAIDEDDTLLLVSDHGMKPVTGRTIYVNELLREDGLLTTTSESPDTNIKQRILGDEGSSGNPHWASKLTNVASRVGLPPERILGAFQRLGIDDTARSLAPDALRSAANIRPDYAASQAYCRLGSEMGIRLNLEGRDPGGVVTKDKYEIVRDQVIDGLSAAQISNGTPLFEFVERYEDFTGQNPTGDAPDIVFLPHEMNHTVSHRMPGVTSLPVDVHDHAKQGVFVAKGPTIGDVPPEIDAVAVAPTALASLGIGMPSPLAARVPDGLLTVTPDRVEANVPYGTAKSDLSDDMTDRLEDLGYL